MRWRWCPIWNLDFEGRLPSSRGRSRPSGWKRRRTRQTRRWTRRCFHGEFPSSLSIPCARSWSNRRSCDWWPWWPLGCLCSCRFGCRRASIPVGLNWWDWRRILILIYIDFDFELINYLPSLQSGRLWHPESARCFRCCCCCCWSRGGRRIPGGSDVWREYQTKPSRQKMVGRWYCPGNSLWWPHECPLSRAGKPICAHNDSV